MLEQSVGAELHSLNDLWQTLSMCYNRSYPRNMIDHNYNLRKRTHNRSLIIEFIDLTERDFLFRMLGYIKTATSHYLYFTVLTFIVK